MLNENLMLWYFFSTFFTKFHHFFLSENSTFFDRYNGIFLLSRKKGNAEKGGEKYGLV